MIQVRQRSSAAVTQTPRTVQRGTDMARTDLIENVIKMWGGPKAIEAEFRILKRSARRLSSNDPRLIDEYPNQWVGIYKGEVCAHGDTFKDVLDSLAKQGCPKNQTIIRYISQYRRAMFL